jgi:hypothetical protein
MKDTITDVIAQISKKRDELAAAIAALTRWTHMDAAPKSRTILKHKKMAWTPERKARFAATMAGKRAAKANKANGAIPGESPTPAP